MERRSCRIYIKSLSPSDVETVKLNASDKSAQVIVPETQLSLAIGKDGQNVRLAAKLCGWKVDIQSDSTKEISTDDSGTELSKNGIDINTEEILKVAGVAKVDQIKKMDDKELLEISGMTEKRLKEVRSQIPAISKPGTSGEDEKAKVEELAEKIVNENEVFSQEDIVEIVESSATSDEADEPELNEADAPEKVKEDDIWNIDSIVKKNNKKSKKGVIRFAEDIEDLKN